MHTDPLLSCWRGLSSACDDEDHPQGEEDYPWCPIPVEEKDEEGGHEKGDAE
jgi:hypothetical protein